MNANHNVTLRYFLTCSTEEVLDEFGRLPHAVRGAGFVYVPGRREFLKRLLLVGHADTVRHTELPLKKLHCSNNTFMTLDSEPLGADDRAGLAMLWLANADSLEHSFLVTDGEERGGIGAHSAAESLPGELLQHAFCIEVDRQGGDEMVFYDGTANAMFKEWLKEQFQGWKQAVGSYTDIATVCSETLICGVNLAAGFHGQHSATERLVYAEWLKTLKALMPVLEMAEYPEFGVPDAKEQRKWDITPYVAKEEYQSNFGYGRMVDHEWNWWQEDNDEPPEAKPTGKLAELDVSEGTKKVYDHNTLWLPVINDAGDVVDYIDPARVPDALFDQAIQDGCVEASDLENFLMGDDDEAVEV